MRDQTLTLEQTPSYLLQLGEQLVNIEQLLRSPQRAQKGIDKPIDIKEAADFLNLEPSTLYLQVQKKTVPFYKRGRRLYFFREELIAWIKTGQNSKANQLESEAEKSFLTANKRKSNTI